MLHLVRSLVVRLRSVACDRRGGMAIIFGLSSFAIFGLVGMLVDLGLVQSQRVKLYQAADAAATAAAKATSDYLRLNSTAQPGPAIAAGRKAGEALFAANITDLALASPPSLNLQVTVEGRSAKAAVKASSVVKTTMLPILGFDAFEIGADVKARSDLPIYYQILFAVDVSGSMAIGGSPQDIERLKANPAIGCAFACHVNTPNPDNDVDKRGIARAAGITLKIDYVTRAMTRFVERMQNAEKSAPGYYSMGVMTMGTTYKMVQAPTSDLIKAQRAAASVDVEPATPAAQNRGFTYLAAGLAGVARDMKVPGDGSSPDRPKTYVLFFSDGVQDTARNGNISDRKIDVDYAEACKAVKTKGSGATLVAIHTPYDIDDGLVNAWLPQAPGAMEACASGRDWSFRAENGADIQKAVDKVFENIASGLRLTN